MEGFKAKLANIEFDMENIKNLASDYRPIVPPNESNADMDLILDTYGQHLLFNECDDYDNHENPHFNSYNIDTTIPSQNILMVNL